MKRQSSGSVVVEAVLVLPVVILLTFGLLEYGWMFLKSQQISDAARQGARYAALPHVTSVGQVTSSGSSPAVVALQAADIPHAGSVSVPTGVNVAPGTVVTVDITVPYEQVQLLGLGIIPTPDSLHSSVSMLKEGP